MTDPTYNFTDPDTPEPAPAAETPAAEPAPTPAPPEPAPVPEPAPEPASGTPDTLAPEAPAEPAKVPSAGDLVTHTTREPNGTVTRTYRVLQVDTTDEPRVWLEPLEVLGPLVAADVEAAGDLT